MTRFLRQHQQLLAYYGVTVLSMRTNRHCVMHCRTAKGRTFKLTISQSPSDWRAIRKSETIIKRYAS